MMLEFDDIQHILMTRAPAVTDGRRLDGLDAVLPPHRAGGLPGAGRVGAGHVRPVDVLFNVAGRCRAVSAGRRKWRT